MRGLTLLAICVGAVLLGAASPARADSITQLPASIASPSMVVDAESQHVFISGGRDQSAIAVLNFDGTVVKTITGEPGASEMAVDPSTHTLYVALYGANAISTIDTHTLTETSRVSVSPLVHPESLVIAGGKVWFSNLTGYNSGYVATMSLDGSSVTQQDLQPGLPPSLYQSVELASGGANNGLLATVQASGGTSLYDVSSGSASQVNGPIFSPDYPHGSSCTTANDVSVDPLGAYFLYAAYTCAAVATTSASGTPYYLPTALNTGAVAWSPDGQYVAASDPNGVQVFPRGSTQLEWGWVLGGGVALHGLAFSPDATHVFAIVGYNGGLGFQVLDRYTAPDTLMTNGPAEGSISYATSASFSFSSDNAPATFQCNLDGGGWTACTSPRNLDHLVAGTHTFAVRSVVGTRIDTVGVSRSWTVTPPNTRLTSGPSASAYAPDATFAFTSDDTNPVVYTCRLDNQAWQPCSAPTSFTGLAPGSHTFSVKAQDSADPSGDADPVGASQTWTILPGGKRLDVFTAGVGFGGITSTPAGIACSISCTAWYASGTSVTLTATPVAGSKFTGWSGACTGIAVHCVVSMTQARAVTAKFVPLPKQLLTVKKLGPGVGTVKSSPFGINCGTTCTHKYAAATVVTLTAMPKSGSTFAGWLGPCTGTGTCIVTMSAAKTVRAKFTLSAAAHRAGSR